MTTKQAIIQPAIARQQVKLIKNRTTLNGVFWQSMLTGFKWKSAGRVGETQCLGV